MPTEIPMYTVPLLDGMRIAEYKGLVTARNVRALNLIRDFFTSFRDTFGGRSTSYENLMQRMQSEVRQELSAQARAYGANAIVGLRLDFDSVGSKNSSLVMAYGVGTAVVLEGAPASGAMPPLPPPTPS